MGLAAEYQAERRTQHHEADVVVVGAGVFGCAAAFAFANQGRSVILLERSLREPDRIVGELLQPGGVAALHRLGLAQCLEGIEAVHCRGYAVIFNGKESIVPYPALDSDGRVITQWWPRASAPTQFETKVIDSNNDPRRPHGRSFHHGRFITQLRRACTGHENITIFETEATELVRDQHSDQVLGVEARTAGAADYFFGQLTIVADGYNSRFRRQLLPATEPVVRSKFYALELLDCPLPRPSFGHVIIGQSIAPVLLYQIGLRETRALIDVPVGLSAAAPAVGGVRAYIRNVVVPALPAAVRDSVLAALDAHPDRIPRSMPNSWLPTVRPKVGGLVLLGDAANMRHPLTGGGMTVALHDAELLAKLLHPDRVSGLADEAAVSSAVSSFFSRRTAHAANVNILAQALYSLFAATDDRLLRALQRGCFQYFDYGVTDGPAGLLAGLIHRPVVLTIHFFTVALLAIWLNTIDVIAPNTSSGVGVGVLLPLMLLRLPLAILDAIMILSKACVVFLPVMVREMR